MNTCKTGNFATIFCVHVCIFVKVMYTCNTGNFCNKPLCLGWYCFRGYVKIQYWEFCQIYFVFMFLFLYIVCTHVRLGILETILLVRVCVVVYVMFTRDDKHFGNKTLCLYLCCCRGYVNM